MRIQCPFGVSAAASGGPQLHPRHGLAASLALLTAIASSACVVPHEDASATSEELSLAQNTTWTIQRGAPQTIRVVAYGDSIFAGFQRSFGQVARRAAPWVAGEYLAAETGSNVEVVRRAQTGGVASEVAALIDQDKSYMAAPSTRAVYFEMCGNDYLMARKKLTGSTGRCDYAELDSALQTCITNTERAMQRINASAPSAARKVVSNLYYPGYDADNIQARCTDANGERVNVQKALFSYMARSNWRVCTLAKQYGFGCADAFAEFMGADVDTNGDGVVDADGLRYDPNESEASYVDRVSVRLRATVRDANHKGTAGAAGATADLIFSDDIHPTAFGPQIGTGTGQGPADFTEAQIVDGKNPQWNAYGHERMGWALWRASH